MKLKKFLGQHFLTDSTIAERITDALHVPAGETVLEIGPGRGILSTYLIKKHTSFFMIEIDLQLVAFLREKFLPTSSIIEADALVLDWTQISQAPLHIVGNFPYHISSPLFFKILQHRDQIPQVVCMVQHEVGKRISSPSGTRACGILSVLLQTYYTIDYLFTVSPSVFHPPPKVNSAVIRLQRNLRKTLPCREEMYVRLVKQAFQQRRKTLRNALKQLPLPADVASLPIMNKRAEQLSVDQFIGLAQKIESCE